MTAVKNGDEIKQTEIDLRRFIHIKGARSNNLKNLELVLPKNQMIVVTGLSGSGKSSLVMDTLYAEGQRRYVESLSAYARQFLNRMKKPDVDFIKGICPAIAIEQRVSTSNARSTVGSLTEIYDYLRLLFARIGKTISPVSGEVVKKHEISDIVDAICEYPKGTRAMIYSPIPAKYGDRSLKQELTLLQQKGYTRIQVKEALVEIEDFMHSEKKNLKKSLLEFGEPVLILIDRIVISDEEENKKRIADSVLTAIQESEGDCIVEIMDRETRAFNNRFELDGISFLEPTHQLFNYNNPYGACKSCEGYGRVLGIDPDKVVPKKYISVYEGAIACWTGEKFGKWLDKLIQTASLFSFPIHRTYRELTDEQKELLWTGNNYFDGLNDFFRELEEKTYKIQNRVMLARYRGKTICPDCKGGRLRKEARYVKIGERSITELIHLPIDQLYDFFQKLELSENDRQIGKRILYEIKNRLRIMTEIGLTYLTLDRLSSTLSGGETQRIQLIRTLGSNLTNSIYILDEPSIGLHPRNTSQLVEVLHNLRDLGNTVMVVEHEEEMIRNADYIVDIGPGAGIYGGEIVYHGPISSFCKGANGSLTSEYLSGDRKVELPGARRKFNNKITIEEASQHNLKNIDVTFPLNAFTVISGVSGSGKSTLVRHILYPALRRHLEEITRTKIGSFKDLTGDMNNIDRVEFINQNPIGRSSRSNPITYVKAYDSIRKLMCNRQLSKIRGYKPKHFSFNVEGGRCETCKGEGEITVEMQFLADVKLICEDCNGLRFKDEILEVKYNGKNIFDVLNLSIGEALTFFEDQRDVVNKIQPLDDVGLGYVKLGQSSSTLSGGEAQRVKLASFLAKSNSNEHIFFIFDEPTTGLHFDDIQKLLNSLNALVENGHTVVVVEHNMEVIKTADWLIDLGPEGGNDGGYLVYEGKPEGIVEVEESYTGKYLEDKLEKVSARG